MFVFIQIVLEDCKEHPFFFCPPFSLARTSLWGHDEKMEYPEEGDYETLIPMPDYALDKHFFEEGTVLTNVPQELMNDPYRERVKVLSLQREAAGTGLGIWRKAEEG